MKLVIERVLKAKVEVEGKEVGKIDKGLLVLLGVGQEDDFVKADLLIEKLLNLRIFEDENKKINYSIKDINGELLIVSQFTLYADCKKGNRPNFMEAAKPEKAEEIYEYFKKKCKEKMNNVQSGIFGAKMAVSLINDGPFTISLEK